MDVHLRQPDPQSIYFRVVPLETCNFCDISLDARGLNLEFDDDSFFMLPDKVHSIGLFRRLHLLFCFGPVEKRFWDNFLRKHGYLYCTQCLGTPLFRNLYCFRLHMRSAHREYAEAVRCRKVKCRLPDLPLAHLPAAEQKGNQISEELHRRYATTALYDFLREFGPFSNVVMHDADSKLLINAALDQLEFLRSLRVELDLGLYAINLSNSSYNSDECSKGCRNSKQIITPTKAAKSGSMIILQKACKRAREKRLKRKMTCVQNLKSKSVSLKSSENLELVSHCDCKFVQ